MLNRDVPSVHNCTCLDSFKFEGHFEIFGKPAYSTNVGNRSTNSTGVVITAGTTSGADIINGVPE